MWLRVGLHLGSRLAAWLIFCRVVGFRVRGLGFRVWGLGFRFTGVGSYFRELTMAFASAQLVGI